MLLFLTQVLLAAQNSNKNYKNLLPIVVVSDSQYATLTYPFVVALIIPTCNIYALAIHHWRYHTNFTNAANLPPMSPQFVYLRQDVFSRNFAQ